MSKDEIILIPEALFWLILARLKVSFIPSGRWSRSLGKKVINDQSLVMAGGVPLKIREIAIVVRGLSLRIPWHSTCMVEALAAHYMLNRRKICNKLHLGVKRNPVNRLEAHAWLSVGDHVIIGQGNLDEFTELGSGI